MSEVYLDLAERLPWQEQVAQEASRFNVVDVGRRSGKTWQGLDLCADEETLPYPMAWFSPTYKMLLEVWRDALRIFSPIIERSTVQDRRIELITGGLLEFWSLENPDAVRGRKYRRMIVDEAAMVPGLLDIWQYTLRPTLADYAGDAWFFSTPKGHNDFWTLYLWGQDPLQPDWKSWQLPSTVGLIPRKEIEEMRRTMPEMVFRQEILAEFIDDAGLVFRRLSEAQHATPQAYKDHNLNHAYIIGVDWGKHNDYSVFAVVDATLKHLVYLDRSNQVDYTVQADRLVALCQRFEPVRVIAEANSMGEANIERVREVAAKRSVRLPIEAYTTTNAGKATLVEQLQNAFEYGEIQVIPDPILLAELQSYEATRTPSGMMRYAAPEGMHDDTVMALLLAWDGAQSPAAVVQHKHRPMAR